MAESPLTPLGQLQGRANQDGVVITTVKTRGVLTGRLTPALQVQARVDENGYLIVAQG